VTGLAGMRTDAQPSHLPVMLAQALDGLRVLGNGRYLDGTFGRGGHARAVLDRLGPEGRLLVMDKDPEAIATAHALFSADPRVAVYRGSFADLGHWDETAPGLDGVFFDLGVFAVVVGATLLILTALAHQSVRGYRQMADIATTDAAAAPESH